MKLFESFNSQAVVLGNYVFLFKNRLLENHYPVATFNLSNFKQKDIKDEQKLKKEITNYLIKNQLQEIYNKLNL
jgi:hypothetical protein